MVELDEDQSSLSSHFSIGILNWFLQISLDIVYKLVKDVLRIEQQKQQDILSTINSDLLMFVQCLLKNIFDNPIKYAIKSIKIEWIYLL